MLLDKKEFSVNSYMKEQLLDCYLDSIPAFVSIKDLNHNYVYLNHQGEQILKVKREDLCDRSYSDYDFYDKTTAKRMQENDALVIQTGRKIKSEELKRDGHGTPYITLQFPVQDREGNTVGVGSFSHDVEGVERTLQPLEKAQTSMAGDTAVSLLNKSSFDMALVRRDGTVLECNVSFAESLQCNRNNIVGACLWHLPLAESVTEIVRREVGNVLQSLEPYHGEVQLNASTWMECNIRPFDVDGGDSRSEVVIELYDITERKKLQLKLQEDEARRKSLLGYVLHEVVLDENGELVDLWFRDVNEAYEEMTGLSAENSIGRKATEVIPGIENDPANWIMCLGRVALEGKTYRFEQYCEPLAKWFIGVAFQVSDRQFGLYFQTIHEHKKIEDELRESEARHKNLFESMMQGIVYQDANSHIWSANASAERILGLTVDQMMGRTSIDPRWRSIHEDGSDFPGETHPAMVALSTGKPVAGVIMGVFHPSDEDYHWINIDAIPRFKPGENKPYEVVCIFTDITETKKIEIALRLAKENAEATDKLKSAFLATMSHEIRTPLNGILGYIDLALSNGLSCDQREENVKGLQVARESGRLLISIIQDILDLSKIEAGQMSVVVETFNVRKMVNQAVSLGTSLIKQRKKHISLEFDISQNISDFVCGDEWRLLQVLNNLISNAIKFTEDGHVGVDVKLIDEKWLEFSVRDSGKGIPEDHLESIFEPFRQVEFGDTRQHGGTGLGLTISKKLVNLMGGRINVSSAVGVGSFFSFTLPYVVGRPEDRHEKNVSTIALQPRSSKPKEGCMILVAEDDPVSRKIAERMLQKAGFNVVLAVDGNDAVQKYKTTNPKIELILMDVQMPIMDGLQATALIREMEAQSNVSKRTPIIALSAGAMMGDREKGLDSGMTDYMTKPVNYKELLEMIERYLGCSGFVLNLD